VTAPQVGATPWYGLPLRGIERIGWGVVAFLRGIGGFLGVTGESLAWTVAGPLYKQPVRAHAAARQIVELGLKSLPLALLFALAFGVILSMQIMTMLETVDLLSTILGFFGHILSREQAPLLVGVLMAARNGSAIASDLSTMSDNGELTALRAMGIEPVRYLVAPTFIAMLIVTPVITLVMIATTLSTVAVYLNLAQGVSPIFVIGLSVDGIELQDLLLSLVKAIVFGFLVIGIAAGIGLRARRGPGVGRAVTFSVVVGITAVLIANAAISLIAAG